MKKITTLITSITFLCAATLHADEATSVQPTPVQVGKAAEEGSHSGRGWGQYVIAGTLIVVAVVALILVAKDKGSN